MNKKGIRSSTLAFFSLRFPPVSLLKSRPVVDDWILCVYPAAVHAPVERNGSADVNSFFDTLFLSFPAALLSVFLLLCFFPPSVLFSMRCYIPRGEYRFDVENNPHSTFQPISSVASENKLFHAGAFRNEPRSSTVNPNVLPRIVHVSIFDQRVPTNSIIKNDDQGTKPYTNFYSTFPALR